MNSEGKETVRVLEDVRAFFGELARLYGSLDPMMSNVEWGSAGGSTAIYETSVSIMQPHKWLPRYVFRFFTHRTRPELLGVVTALLSPDYLDGNEDGGPLLSGLIFDYGPGNEIGSEWKFVWATWHGKVDGAVHNGEVVTVPREPGSDECPAVRIATWAVPLLSITDSVSLKRHTADMFDWWVRENPSRPELHADTIDTDGLGRT